MRDLYRCIIRQKQNIKALKRLKMADKGLTDGEKWCFENKYKLIQLSKNTLAELKGFRKTSKRGEVGTVKGFFEKLLTDCAYSIDEEKLINRIREYQSGDRYFTLNELAMMKTIISMILFDRAIKGVVKTEMSELVSVCIKQLLCLDDIDFLYIFESVSLTEEVLKSDPSGVYEACDGKTKGMYRRKLSEICKREKTEELAKALEYRNLAERGEGKTAHIGYYIMENSVPRYGKLYFHILNILPAFMFWLSAYAAVMEYNIWLFLIGAFSYFPLRSLLKSLISDIVAKSTVPDILPRLSIGKIADEGKTLVVYTSILTDPEKDKSLFNRLSNYARAYDDKNLKFAILADFCDSECETVETDEKILESAKSEIDRINADSGNATLFWRNRSYSKSERKYIGKERKRGAQEALVSLLCGEASELFLHGDADISGVNYILALDSDTEIMYEDIKKLIGTALHPYSQPIYSEDEKFPIVKSGFGILQPKTEMSLANIDKFNSYTLLKNSFDGRCAYESAAFSVYSKLLGVGSFCGKGLINVKAYRKALTDAFPSETILSHDTPEGVYMRVGYASDVEVFDSPPKNYISERKRADRWMRGDVQSSVLSFKKIRSSDGRAYDSRLDFCGRAILREPLFDIATDIVRAPFAILSLTFLGKYGLLIFTIFICDHIYTALKNIFNSVKIPYRRYLSGVLNYQKAVFFDLTFKIISAADKCACAINALTKALFRLLASKKNLLEWTVSSVVDGKSEMSVLGHFICFKASVVLGMLSIMLSFYSGRTNGFLLMFNGVLWISFPVVVMILNKKQSASNKVTALDGDSLRSDAERMWGYFSKYVTKKYNYLPPDNVTFLPKNKVAERTSPTNIGMYLISVVNAFDFGFINSDELYRRVSFALDTIEKLEKWKGNLYNWYDIKDLSVLYPAYVSTVDSGNFMAALLVLKNAISGMGLLFEKLAMRISKLIEETDLGSLYNKKRELFYIGYNSEKEKFDDNVYDLYASEMLTTSYLAYAYGNVGKVHFSTLGRMFVDFADASPMISWGGSVFEYFMPSIFLPTLRKSERGEMLLTAHYMQKQNSAKFDNKMIYGVSESSYYDFDDSMSYSYRSFGAKGLALSRDSVNAKVYAPYSLYLMLGYGVESVINSLRDTDAFGKYGFYDAVDLTEKRVGKGYGVTKIYMAHHIGMSIAATANYLFDGINIKRFMADPKLKAAFPILYDKNEICRPKSHGDEDVHSESLYLGEDVNGVVLGKGASVLSNGRTRIIGDSNGNILIFDGDNVIFQSFEFGRGLTILLKIGDKVYDCLKVKESITGASTEFVYDGGTIEYKTKIIAKNGAALIDILFMTDAKTASVDIRMMTKKVPIGSQILVYAPIVLNRERDYVSAPAYSDIFVIGKRDGDDIIYKMNNANDESRMMRISIGNKKAPMDIFANIPSGIPFLYDDKDVEKLFNIKENELLSEYSPLIYPVFGAVFDVIENDLEVNIKISFDDANKMQNDTDIMRQDSLRQFELQKALSGVERSSFLAISKIISSFYFQKRQMTKIDGCKELSYKRDILWRRGISGDLPIVLIKLPHIASVEKQKLSDLLSAKRFLFVCGVRFDLVIMFVGDGYLGDSSRVIRELCEKRGCEKLIGKNNGIFYFDETALSDNDKLVFYAIASDVIDLSVSPSTNMIRPERKKPVSHKLPRKSSDNKYYNDGTEIVIWNGEHGSPWSMIYANPVFGTLMTNRTLGYSWYKNSSMGTITSRHVDPRAGIPGEVFELIIDGNAYDLSKCAEKTEFLDGCAVYEGDVNGVEYKLSVGVHPQLPIKLYHLSVKMIEKSREDLNAVLTVYPSAPSVVFDDGIKLLSENDVKIKISVYPKDLYLKTDVYSDSVSVSVGLMDGECGFVLSAASEKCFRRFTNALDEMFDSPRDILKIFDEYARKKRSLIASRPYNGEKKWLSDMLPLSAYQAFYFRMIARTGYYQSGGAYGFRDQLQDSLSALYYEPDYTKYQIFRSCAHQYDDGRVQHWWHPDIGGVKTRCSDDYMWLPFVLSEYISATGDTGILDLKIPYLTSQPLSEKEHDRYENPLKTKKKYTVFDHAMRAVSASLWRGCHGLPLMLDGDWNDGMNKVGASGRGESVWLAFFFVLTYRKLADALLICGEDFAETSEGLYKMSYELLKNIEANSWDGKWYLRAYDDDGIPLGSSVNDECEIDAIPQVFSVFAKADKSRTISAMNSVKEHLYDEKLGILRLFAPSFDKTKKYGYICNYPPGVRENGGQYTHAAVWAAMAFFESGDHETGMKIMRSVTPFDIYERGAMDGKYTAEPYLICADIYYGDGIIGMSGWSGYTGSAAWYYRCAMKYILGITPYLGDLVIRPPEYIKENYSCVLRYKTHEISVYVSFDGEYPQEDSYGIISEIKRGDEITVTPNGEDIKILLKVHS